MTQEINEIYPWQEPIWQHLQGYITQQRVPQALLLSGPQGLGKRQIAEIYAKRLLCQTPLNTPDLGMVACGGCVSCHLLSAGTHPDFIRVEPDAEGKVIGIDNIRQLIIKLALKPQFETYRLVIMQPADRLNTASANAFLKCLEEPNERTCFILLTDQAYRLPATIRSRCQKLSCGVPDTPLAETWLLQQGVSEGSTALLKMADGAPLLAKHYAERGYLPQRLSYFDAWLKIAQGKANILMVAEQWQKPDTIDLPLLLNWLSSWVMDIIKLAQTGGACDLLNPDLISALQSLVSPLNIKPLYHYYDTLLRSKALASTQLNKQLLIERLLIDWSQLHKL
jgi:DNA polymerase-3 subunit delta'